MVVEGKDIKVWFPMHEGLFGAKRQLRAVDGVSFRVREGETLGVVGRAAAASPPWRAPSST
uniref:Uncharacterized protein n=1 Tax=Phenylobacterium glaciei TaxID=2803784 RepID=A0A974S7X5_9CAUL|nr:hypothetical protein JKL49_01965 [Phenylobacterium glaciei]